MSDSKYSVIKSDVLKRFDCLHHCKMSLPTCISGNGEVINYHILISVFS